MLQYKMGLFVFYIRCVGTSWVVVRYKGFPQNINKYKRGSMVAAMNVRNSLIRQYGKKRGYPESDKPVSPSSEENGIKIVDVNAILQSKTPTLTPKNGLKRSHPEAFEDYAIPSTSKIGLKRSHPEAFEDYAIPSTSKSDSKDHSESNLQDSNPSTSPKNGLKKGQPSGKNGLKRSYPEAFEDSIPSASKSETSKIISNDEEDLIEKIEVSTSDEEYERLALENFPGKIVYMDPENIINHEVVYLKPADEDEEDEELVVDDEDSDTDILEIKDVVNEPIEIPDDDDDVDDDEIQEKEQDSCSTPKDVRNIGPISTPPAPVQDKPHERLAEGFRRLKIVTTPKRQPVDKILVSATPVLQPANKGLNKPRSVMIGGVVKKLLNAQDLKSGAIQFSNSLINKNVIKGTPIRIIDKKLVERKEVLLKPLPNQSLLKQKDTVNDTQKEQQSIPSLNVKEILGQYNRQDPQAILQRVKDRAKALLQSQAKPIKINKSLQVKKAVCCSYCSLIFLSEKHRDEHVISHHPEAAKAQCQEAAKAESQEAATSNPPKATKSKNHTYSVAEMVELERELKDHSEHCQRCRSALCCLPTLRSHANSHSEISLDCEPCRHGNTVIKDLIVHLEEHAVGSDDSD